jgi:class 3 adenylate cyclase/tetratricopeptide (TPR) repeat protein
VTNSADNGQRSASPEDRLSLLIARLLASMDTAASTGAWDRAVELANDVLAVDHTNRGAQRMIDRARLERSLPGGQRAFVSLVFADIVRSTDMAEVVEPEVVQDVFTLYRRVAAETMEELGGRVLQFQGDGVVACFGYPTAHEDDARRAVLAGLRLIERMAHAAIELHRRNGIELDLRVGVHSGTVVVSGLASGVIDGSALAGSVPNVAARLQAEAEPGTVVISDTTRHLVESHFELKPAGARLLKGIVRPMDLHVVVRSNLEVPPSGRGLPESVVLVGREGETRLLRFIWKGAVHDARGAIRPEESVVVMRGVAGIGKSALAAELAAHVRIEGSAVLEAYCSPYHRNVALWPVARMLEQLPGLYPDQPEDERLNELETLLAEAGLGVDALPLVAPLLGLNCDERRSRPEVDALALRQQTLQVLVAWLTHTAAATPALVVAEDLHWADPTTIDLLGLLATQGAPGTMILITSQLSLTTPWASAAVDIELQPLKEKEAAGLVAALTDNGLDPEQVHLIVERGAGIPLFLQELTHSALTAQPGEVLPPRIHEILTARIRAPGVDLRVAQLAASLGAEFDEELLRQLTGRAIDDALARLEEAALVERVAEVRLGRYRFRQSLLRDAAYETQVLPVRQETHRRIAHLLEPHATSPGDLAVVAQHWDLSGDAARSIPAYLAAASAAQSAASHTEARQQLARALELASTLPADDERDVIELVIRSQRTLSTSSQFGYGHPDVLEDFTIAEGICRKLTNRPEIMPAQVGIWSYLLVRGSVNNANLVLEPLVNTLDDPASAWFVPEIKSCMGYGAFYQGRLDEAHRLLVEAWEGYCARSVDAASSPFWPLPHDAVPITAVALACVAALQGSTEESAIWERRAIATAEELEFPTGPFSAAFVFVYLAWIRMVTGKRDQAREFGQRAIEIAERCHFDYFRLLGTQYLLLPEPERPCDVKQLEEYALGMDLVGHAAFRATHLGIVAQNHYFRGDVDQALRALEMALDASSTSGEFVHQPDLFRLRAEITAGSHSEQNDQVVNDLVAAVQIGLAQGSCVLALRAANDLGRLTHQRPTDWSERIRVVLERFPPNSSSPELAEALALLGA